MVRYNNFALLKCLVQQWSMFTWLSFKLNVNDVCVSETTDHVDMVHCFTSARSRAVLRVTTDQCKKSVFVKTLQYALYSNYKNTV